MSRSPVDTVRRPEHTGERRCWPCTVVNAVLVVGVALALARRRRLAALPVLLAGATLVYLRGYVVPGTPWFAPRLVATLPLPYDPFDRGTPGHEPPEEALAGPATGTKREAGDSKAPVTERPAAAGESDTLGDVAEGTSASNQRPVGADDALEPDGEAVLGALVEAGVVVVDDERVAPDPAFREVWEAEMADLAALDTPALAEAVHEVAHAAGVRAVTERGEWVVLDDGSGGFAGQAWLPRPVAVAEAGAVRALEGTGLDRPTRLAAAGPLRTFLETCPDCGAGLSETTTASCCGGTTNPREVPSDVLFCPDCDVRLFTFED